MRKNYAEKAKVYAKTKTVNANSGKKPLVQKNVSQNDSQPSTITQNPSMINKKLTNDLKLNAFSMLLDREQNPETHVITRTKTLSRC